MSDQFDVPPEEVDEGEAAEPAERRVERWRQSAAAGAVAASMTYGLQQVFDPERKDTVAVEQEAPGEPDDPGAVDLHFDPTDSTRSYVVVRPPPEEPEEPE